MRLAEREPLLHADEHVADIFLHVEEKDILIHPAEVAHNVIRLPHLVVVLELLRDILKFCLIDVQRLGRGNPLHRDAIAAAICAEGHHLRSLRSVDLPDLAQDVPAQRMIFHMQAALSLLLVAYAKGR